MRVHRIPGSHSPSVAFACPLCGRPVAPEIRSLTARIEVPIARNLKRDHPAWVSGAGACPECVQRAAELNRLWRSQTSIQEELLLPYPVYSPDAAYLLPTPQRLGASSQYSGQGVTLAFLDSGFYPHLDLVRPVNRILCYADATGAEVVERAHFNKPHSSSWHGLMTACIAAGSGFKSAHFYRGIAYRASLVLVKTGHRGGHGISEADIQRALAWVIANQARFNIRVVNISLGGDHPAHNRLGELDRLVEDAVARGMVVVAAAGNGGIERLVPPASAPSAITVGGLDDRNSLERHLWRTYHSNFGRSSSSQPKPEIIAPAIWLAAPMLPHTRVHNEGMLLWRLDRSVDRMYHHLMTDRSLPLAARDSRYQQLEKMRRQLRTRMIEQKYIHPHYQHVDGTSMAAPIVTSIVAQMLEANPDLAPGKVRDILIETAIPLERAASAQQGAGVVNAARAVALARRRAAGPLHGLPLSPDVGSEEVTFYYFDPSHAAARVALAGSFNDWDPQGYAMRAPAPGLWQISIPLPPPGSYRYKFLVDDSWLDDPENSFRLEDGYGGFSSVLDV